MKNKADFFIAVLLIIVTVNLSSQTLFTRQGEISIYSKTPLEEIDAVNNKAVSVLSLDEGRVEFSVLIKGFLFTNALMQTHFNENYMDSDQFPKSVFKSDPFDASTIRLDRDGKYSIPISGSLTVRDISQTIEPIVEFVVDDGKLSASTQFMATPQDYGIEIPAGVRDKIASEITINVRAEYQPYEKE